jgi:hypothetical protein
MEVIGQDTERACSRRFLVYTEPYGSVCDASTRCLVRGALGRHPTRRSRAARALRKHVGVLERAELVATEKVGRVRTCKLGPRRLEEETAWMERHRQLWDSRFDELDQVVEDLKRKEKVDERNQRK